MSQRQNSLTIEQQETQAVQALTALHERCDICAMSEVGRLVLAHCATRPIVASGAPHWPQALELERLASRADCPFSHSALHQAVSIHLICQENPALLTYQHIGPSHVLVTLSLSHLQRTALLAAAESQRFSVRRLHAEAQQLTTESPAHQLAPRSLERSATVMGALRSLGEAQRVVETALSDVVDQGVGPDDLPELLDALFELESLCSDLSRRVRQSSITVPPPPVSSMVELSPRARQENLSSALLDAAKAFNTRHG